MEFYLPIVAQYASILIASSLVLFLIGRSIIFLLPEWRDKNNAYQTVLNSFLLGYTVVIPLFAIIWSRANTIFWLAVVLWLFYLLWWRQPQKPHVAIDWRSEGHTLGLSLLLLLSGFALLYYFCFVRSEGQIFSDQIYASNLAHSILSYHNEAYYRTAESIAQTYHWGDSWTTALWSFVFGAKPIYVLYGVTYPFLLAMCILGVMAIAKGMPNALPVVLCLIFGVLYFFQYNITSKLTPWGCGGNISGLKDYLMIVFSVWGASYIIKGMYAPGFFALLMLVVYYSPLAAGVLTLVCLLSCFMPDRPKLSFRQLFNPFVIGAIVLTLCYGLFYALQPDIFTEGAFTRHANHSNMWILGFIVKRICRPIAGMTPIALVLGLYLYKTNIIIWHKYVVIYICILASCFIACVVGGCATKFEINAGQIATNFYSTFSHLFVFLSLIYLLSELARKYKVVVYILIVVMGIAYPARFFCTGAKSSMFPIEPMSQSEKAAYITLQQIFETRQVHQMGYLRNYTLPENRNNPKTEYDLYFPMDRLVHILPNGYHPYCLSAYDMTEDMNPKWVDMSECELWQYGAKRQIAQPDISNEVIISEFITLTDINYIFVETGARLPEFLQERFNLIFDYEGNKLYYGQ